MRYALDGLLITAGVNLVANNNYFFASRLGANDYQLSLVQFLPQIVNFIILIPGGLLIDSLFNKRRMVRIMLFITAIMYAIMGLLPFFIDKPLTQFIGLISVSTGILMLHNISWLSYFTEVVPARTRNHVLTLRTQMSVFVGMLIPLVAGAVLTLTNSENIKIIIHQCFFFISVLLLVLTSHNFRKLTAVNPAEPKKISLSEIKNAGRSLIKNKPFLLFTGIALFFYMTWHLDWTLYFIGQQQYLKMNEFLIMLATVGATATQFLTMRFWSKMNERFGVVFPVTFGIIGLGFCPVAMMVSLSLPLSISPYVFLTLHFIANFCFATISLNFFQCLLQVLGKEYLSLSISIYTCLICLSNAIMPVAGVALYKALGNDLNGLRLTFLIIFVLRLIAALFWFLRWRFAPKPTENTD